MDNKGYKLGGAESVPTTIEKQDIVIDNVDVALGFVQNAGPLDESIRESKLMRKVDWMLMPLMFGCYYLQYTDKTLRMFSSVYFTIHPY